MGTLRIGVVGGRINDEYHALYVLGTAFGAVLKDYPDIDDIWVVLALSDLGVPSLAYRVALARGWKTYGIIDIHRIEEQDYSLVDKSWFVNDGSEEMGAVVANADVLIRVGNGENTDTSVLLFRAGGGKIYEYELTR